MKRSEKIVDTLQIVLGVLAAGGIIGLMVIIARLLIAD